MKSSKRKAELLARLKQARKQIDMEIKRVQKADEVELQSIGGKAAARGGFFDTGCVTNTGCKPSGC